MLMEGWWLPWKPDRDVARSRRIVVSGGVGRKRRCQMCGGARGLIPHRLHPWLVALFHDDESDGGLVFALRWVSVAPPGWLVSRIRRDGQFTSRFDHIGLVAGCGMRSPQSFTAGGEVPEDHGAGVA